MTAIPPLDHDEAVMLAEAELGRLLALVDDLDEAEWAGPPHRLHGRDRARRARAPARHVRAAGRPGGARAADQVRRRRSGELRLDAVEFCRTLSGRERGTGLLATPVTF